MIGMLSKRDGNWYGENHADIRDELLRYSKNAQRTSYHAQHFADVKCLCGSSTFELALDDAEGVAIRTCTVCSEEHPMGDSDEFLEDATLEECQCPCGNEEFEISCGVSLYDDSNSVKWFYIGCRCVVCGLTACYGDWKNEFEGFQQFLDRV